MIQPLFLFAACRPGSENTLKRELSRTYPYLRFAFSRPGFLTFKWEADELPNERWRLRSVFARTWGWSLGFVPDLSETTIREIVEERLDGLEFDRLHAWHRELVEGADGVPTVTSGDVVTRTDGLRRALLDVGRLRQDQPTNSTGHTGERIVDLVRLDDDRWALGWHLVDSFEQSSAGGVPSLTAPPNMVSRAYLKMREALLWSGFPLKPNDQCVEIGSSPGGACQALLEDGMRVTGIDPAPMHPELTSNTRFRHIQKRGADVRRREYATFRWLFADANVAPRYTLDTVESIVQNQHTEIQGMILTLKLMDWKLADNIAEYAYRVRSWGFTDIRCRQLACNHQEICLAALRK